MIFKKPRELKLFTGKGEIFWLRKYLERYDADQIILNTGLHLELILPNMNYCRYRLVLMVP